MLRYREQNGDAIVTPRLPSKPMTTSPFIDMTSGYFERSRATMPLQGDEAPWGLQQHYAKDSALYLGAVNDEGLEFGPRPANVQSQG